MLFVLLQTCNRNPCKHGGTCTQDQLFGQITCHCLPEVNILPFIDDKCNIGKHDFDNKGRILVLDWKNSNSNKNKKTLMNSGKD